MGRLQRLRAEQRVQLFTDLVKGPESRLKEFRELAPQGQAEELLKALGGPRKKKPRPMRRHKTRAELAELVELLDKRVAVAMEENRSLKYQLSSLSNQLLNVAHEHARVDKPTQVNDKLWFELGTSALRSIEKELAGNRSTLADTGQELIDKGYKIFELQLQLERATDTIEVLTYMARKVMHIPTASR